MLGIWLEKAHFMKCLAINLFHISLKKFNVGSLLIHIERNSILYDGIS